MLVGAHFVVAHAHHITSKNNFYTCSIRHEKKQNVFYKNLLRIQINDSIVIFEKKYLINKNNIFESISLLIFNYFNYVGHFTQCWKLKFLHDFQTVTFLKDWFKKNNKDGFSNSLNPWTLKYSKKFEVWVWNQTWKSRTDGKIVWAF